jgi:hypothetical protein
MNLLVPWNAEKLSSGLTSGGPSSSAQLQAVSHGVQPHSHKVSSLIHDSVIIVPSQSRRKSFTSNSVLLLFVAFLFCKFYVNLRRNDQLQQCLLSIGSLTYEPISLVAPLCLVFRQKRNCWKAFRIKKDFKLEFVCEEKWRGFLCLPVETNLFLCRVLHKNKSLKE